MCMGLGYSWEIIHASSYGMRHNVGLERRHNVGSMGLLKGHSLSPCTPHPTFQKNCNLISKLGQSRLVCSGGAIEVSDILKSPSQGHHFMESSRAETPLCSKFDDEGGAATSWEKENPKDTKRYVTTISPSPSSLLGPSLLLQRSRPGPERRHNVGSMGLLKGHSLSPFTPHPTFQKNCNLISKLGQSRLVCSGGAIEVSDILKSPSQGHHFMESSRAENPLCRKFDDESGVATSWEKENPKDTKRYVATISPSPFSLLGPSLLVLP